MPYTVKDTETSREETARPWPAELRRLQGILLGEIEPGAMVREMKDFFADAFSCAMLDCYPGDFSDRRTVCFVLESFADLDKLRMQGSREFDAEKLTKIREKYSELCRKYGADKNCQNPNWYYALPVTAERELKCIVIGESFDDLEKAIAEFPLVKGHQYYYDRIYVVYESAEATRKNESNGVSKEISEKVLSVLKEHDRFGIVHSVDIAFVPVEDEPVHRPIGFSSGE